MIKKATIMNEAKKRKRADSDEDKSKSKVNFTRLRCYSDEDDLEKDVQTADGQMSKMNIEADK